MMDQIRSNAYATLGGAIAAVLAYAFRTRVEAFAGQPFPDGIEAMLGVLCTWSLSFVAPILLRARDKLVGFLAGLAVLCVVGAGSASATPNGRIPLSKRAVGTGTAAYEVDELRIAPMVVLNAVSIPLDRRAQFEAGVDVGGCYGLHYSPAWWDEAEDDPFASVGVCFETGLVVGSTTGGPEGSTYLALQPGLAVSVMRWISVGVAWRYRLALTDDGKDNGSPVLTFGLTAATF